MEKMIYKKKYGQNFLVDQHILKKIYEIIDVTPNDLIIEIGPGSGNLTKWLKKYDCQILAFEIDSSLEEKLKLIQNAKTKVIYKDILDVDLLSEIKAYKYDNLYVIANIPYYITTPIIEKIIDSKINPKEIILMVQKEVAERFSAVPKTKNYGYITVFLNYYFNIKKMFIVNKNSFYPVPKVDSAIIKLQSKDIGTVDINKFNNLIKDAFKHKRKNLKNNLEKYDTNKINNILNNYGFSLTNRAEEIPLDVFLHIVEEI